LTNRPGAALRLDFVGDSDDDDEEYPALGRFKPRYIMALFEFVLRFEAFRGAFNFFLLFLSFSLAKYNSCEKFVNRFPRFSVARRNFLRRPEKRVCFPKRGSLFSGRFRRFPPLVGAAPPRFPPLGDPFEPEPEPLFDPEPLEPDPLDMFPFDLDDEAVDLDPFEPQLSSSNALRSARTLARLFIFARVLMAEAFFAFDRTMWR
jgi:hypothetical protein